MKTAKRCTWSGASLFMQNIQSAGASGGAERTAETSIGGGSLGAAAIAATLVAIAAASGALWGTTAAPSESAQPACARHKSTIDQRIAHTWNVKGPAGEG